MIRVDEPRPRHRRDRSDRPRSGVAVARNRLPVRAMSRNPRTGALPSDVELVRGDLSAPETLDRCLMASTACSSCGSRRSAAAAPAIETDRANGHGSRAADIAAPHASPVLSATERASRRPRRRRAD